MQAIVDHHHPHEQQRTTITKVRFVDPSKDDPPTDKPTDENTEVNFDHFIITFFS